MDNQNFDNICDPDGYHPGYIGPSYQFEENNSCMDMYDYYTDLENEMNNSSPSPSERNNNYSFPQSQAHYPEYYNDEIYEYEDAEAYEPAQIQNNKSIHAIQSQIKDPSFSKYRVAESSHNSHDSFTRDLPNYNGPLECGDRHNHNDVQYPQLYQGITHRNDTFNEVAGDSRGSKPRNAHGIRLRPVSELPDIYRGIFKFGVFNAVQSTCFDDINESDRNMVISAPTGSGKTVLFELAIIRLLSQARTSGQSLKCVYMAPTKALCSERYRDWAAKFDPLGVKCCELTGDTVHFGRGAWGDAKKSSIIITTGEKWDSLTRNWRGHDEILSQIQLFLVDEIHILNESRGSTLEVVVSHMKTRGSAVRFVLVSATVPNINDIAAWIGTTGIQEEPAKVFEFGEEFRPCRLTRFVIGIPRQKGQNEFSFAKTLDHKLFAALQKHSVGKPILVFCSTRKGVFATAEQLMKEYSESEKNKLALPWSHPSRIDHNFHDKRLSELASYGIGVHHAGLSMDDRRATEDLYLKKILRIIIATSTLAVGVNLPAHMVVIKGVQMFQNNSIVEYSDLDIMQMLGRAGRPQFDKDGIALIFCETELENKYKALVQGKTVIESCLHVNLSEHLNSEIGLGTITDITSAKEWLRGSFLFQRIRKNPKHYALGKEDNQTWEERIDDLVTQSVSKLRKTELIEYADEGDESEKLCSTEYGDIMSKLYIRQSTMSLILALPEYPSLREVLEMISASEELCDTKMRASEKTIFNKLRKHNDIRFEVKKVEKTSDKVFLLIQAVLGGISLTAAEYKSGDSQPQFEAFTVFRHISRIARAIVEVAVVKKLGAQVKHGLELVRCLTAKAWEDRPVVLRQIEHIGEKSLMVLAEHGIVSLDDLRKQDTLRIELLLNRRPPFGLDVLACLKELPQYTLKITEEEILSNGGKGPVEVHLSVECGLVEEQYPAKAKKQKGRGANMTAILTLTSDMDFIDFRRIPTKALNVTKTFEIIAELKKPSQSVIVSITSETIAGTTVNRVYKPKLSSTEYPTMDTRPPTSTDMDLAGLEDDPDFWSMDIDDKGEEVVPPRDLTKSRMTKTQSTRKDEPLSKHLSANTPQTQLSTAVKKLPNGNYECNHSCKDKKKCRHMCCRDGLPEPHSQKKRTSTEGKPKHETANTSSRTNQSKSKNPAARVDINPALEKLELLHERTNVSKSLKLPEGQRLKLDTSKQSQRKRKPPPDFNVEFADLKDSTLPSASAYDVADLDDNDDELPELYNILKGASTPSSETNYSNPNIDALILALPSSEGQDENVPERTIPYKTEVQNNSASSLKKLFLAPSSSASSREYERHIRPVKRAKFDDQSDKNRAEFSLSPCPCHRSYRSLEGIESPHIESPCIEISDDENEDNFHGKANLDHSSSYSGQTPSLVEDNEVRPDSDHECVGYEAWIAKPIMERTLKRTSDHTIQSKNDNIVNEADEFAELDAWLNSGAVEIVYN